MSCSKVLKRKSPSVRVSRYLCALVFLTATRNHRYMSHTRHPWTANEIFTVTGKLVGKTTTACPFFLSLLLRYSQYSVSLQGFQPVINWRSYRNRINIEEHKRVEQEA